MRRIFLVLSLLLFCASFTSTGIVERISKIPNPIKSYFQGLKNKESGDTFSFEDASIFNVDDLQIPDSYIKPGTVNKINKPIDVVNDVQKKRPAVRPRPSSTRPRPASSTRPRPASSTRPRPASSTRPRPASSTRPRPASSTRPRPSSSSNTKHKPTTKRPKIKTEASVIPPDSGSLPVTGAHAVVATHMGEISVFTSEGRLWLNGPNIPKPVPLGSALDSESIAVSNKDAYHLWVNTTSWSKLVSLEEIRNRRRPVVIDNDPKYRKKAILERKPLQRSTTTESPIPLRIKGTYQYDTCGLNIIIPLTADRKILMEQAIRPNYKSTGFPEERDYPLVCTWNVKVNKVCRRARITMKLDERSRLPDEEECAKGYLRISPFMNETKICGRIDSIPAFHWYVEDQKPNDVTITMKNIGINDGFSEGLSFTLQGECLPIERGTFDVNQENSDAYSNWMDRLLTEASAAGHGATISIPSGMHTSLDPPISPAPHQDDTNRLFDFTRTDPVDQNFGDALSYNTTLLDVTHSTNTR